MKILFFFSFPKSSSVGQVTLNRFLLDLPHNFFLKKFNFGKPDILKISLVLKLNILKSINGSEVIKWANIKS